MKHLILGLAIAGLSFACQSEPKTAVGEGEALPASECCEETGGECTGECSGEMTECSGEMTECSGEAEGEVCPVTGKPAG